MNNKFSVLLTIFSLIFVFSHCGETNKKNVKKELTDSGTMAASDYLEKGKQIAAAAQKTLGKNLMAAIQNKGFDGALEFCNLHAIPLTDSISMIQNASIKRVSDNYRNPANAANKGELEFIQKAKADIKISGVAKPQIHNINNEMVGYYPIVTMGLCLNCHGDIEKDINTKTLAAIQDNYPTDKAINYKENQLRGIWVIQMNKLD